MKSLIDIALGEYGNKEVAGAKHNDEVVKYFAETGFEQINDDETPWCSAFMMWVAKMAGLERPKSLAARSWLEVGSIVKDPQPGDVAIFWRGAKGGWQGHVGVFIRHQNGKVYCLGGNQSNMVSITGYAEDKVLGFRRLFPVCEVCKHK